jgi:hypothetical protein
MSRNGSGTYSVPNTFVSGTVITAADHNENWSDIVAEMTNSVAADGQTTMTGPLKLQNGSVGAPSITFASDTDSGVYRIGADNVGIAAGGVKIVDINADRMATAASGSFAGTLSATGNFAINSDKFTVTASSGNTQVGGTFAVTGNSTLSGTMTVSGATTLQSATTVNSTLTVGSDATFSANISAATISGNVRATQAQMESDSSTTVVVTPSVMRHSPWIAKAWGVVAGGSGAVQAALNATVSRTGVGAYTVSFGTNMSTDAYAPIVQVIDGSGNLLARVDSQSTSNFTITIRNTSAGAADPTRFAFAVFGDFA